MKRQLRNFARSNESLYHATRRLRMAWLRRWYGLRHVDPTSFVQRGSKISTDLVLGAYSSIAWGALVGPGVTIGNYVMFAPKVAIVGLDHVTDVPGTPMIFSGRPEPAGTVIEDDVWIGYGVTIMSGTRIGRGAVVAAGSIVTKDVAPYAIVAGVPAQKIRDRFPDAADRQKHDEMLAAPPSPGRYAAVKSDF